MLVYLRLYISVCAKPVSTKRSDFHAINGLRWAYAIFPPLTHTHKNITVYTYTMKMDNKANKKNRKKEIQKHHDLQCNVFACSKHFYRVILHIKPQNNNTASYFRLFLIFLSLSFSLSFSIPRLVFDCKNMKCREIPAIITCVIGK